MYGTIRVSNREGIRIMTNENARLFKDLEIMRLFCWDYKNPQSADKFIEKLNGIGTLLWDVDGDKCYGFVNGATLTVWHNGQCDFDADGVTLALRGLN